MSANLAAFLYLVSGVLLHPGAARPVAPDDLAGRATSSAWSAWRSPSLTTLAARPPAGAAGLAADRRSASRIGGGIGAVIARRIADDGDAAARRRLPLAGRPRRRARRGRRALRARRPSASARRGDDPRRQPGRDGARRRHRRHHLHRLDHRLPQARRAHVAASRSCCRSATSSTSALAVAAAWC